MKSEDCNPFNLGIFVQLYYISFLFFFPEDLTRLDEMQCRMYPTEYNEVLENTTNKERKLKNQIH